MKASGRKKKSFLFKLLLLLALFYTAAGLLTDAVTRHYLPSVERSALKSGAVISGISFQKAGLASWRSLKWEGVSAHLKPRDSRSPGREFSFIVDRLELDIGAAWEGVLLLKGSNMSLSQISAVLSQGKPEPKKVKSIQGDFSLRVKIKALSSRGAAAAIRKSLKDISMLVREGRSEADLEYRGTSYFSIKGTRFFAQLYTVREGGEVRLVMNAEDVSRIAVQLDEELTPAEILLISRNPVRAQRLFEIKETARRKAAEAAVKDEDFPQDAYKHVLWSYLLTREYGESFAKEVTDAHEEGSRKNTQADHLMDYQNNVVGSRYALEKIAEADVLGRFLKDPSVIRTASAAKKGPSR